MNDFNGIEKIIHTSESILLTSHQNPDGDALGSVLALALALEQMGKDVTCYNRSGTPPHLSFIPHSGRVRSSLADIPATFDTTFILDCTDTGRVGDRFEDEIGTGRFGKTVIIDHHHTQSKSADIHLVDFTAPATGYLIYLLLKHMQAQITPDIATCLFTAIMTDTGSFRFNNTTPDSMRVAAELMEIGAAPYEVAKSVYESEPFEKMRLLALAMNTLELHLSGRVATITVDAEMFRTAACTNSNTEGFVDIPRSIKGVEVAVFFKQSTDNSDHPVWKLSLRSKRSVDVSAIAESLGGGGHVMAAGCTVSGTLEEAKERVLGLIHEGL